MARYGGSGLPAVPPGGHEALPEGRPLLHRQVRVERRAYPPGQHGQGARALLGLRPAAPREAEGQAHVRRARAPVPRTMDEATRMRGGTGENLLELLERRLDNVVFRLGFATSRAEARQLVRHGHFQVNGRKATIPSLPREARATWSRCARARARSPASPGRSRRSRVRSVPGWLEIDKERFAGVVKACRRATTSRCRSRSSSSSSSTPASNAEIRLEGEHHGHATGTHREELARSDPPAASRGRGRRRDALRALLVRAARARLRPDARQLAPPRAAVVAPGRRDHDGADRGRAARVHHDPGRARGRRAT